MPLVPEWRPYTLQEIATEMAKVCWTRGYRIGWVQPVNYETREHHGPSALLTSDYFPRDWMGRLVTDIPARLVEDCTA